jgi:hypothetical protein
MDIRTPHSSGDQITPKTASTAITSRLPSPITTSSMMAVKKFLRLSVRCSGMDVHDSVARLDAMRTGFSPTIGFVCLLKVVKRILIRLVIQSHRASAISLLAHEAI